MRGTGALPPPPPTYRFRFSTGGEAIAAEVDHFLIGHDIPDAVAGDDHELMVGSHFAGGNVGEG